jgi:uncharacterized protein with PQ loop repeat
MAAEAFSSFGVLCNYFVFGSQIPLMRSLIKERDASQYSALPSITMLMAMSLWSGYTVYIAPTLQLYFANVPGMFFATAYLLIFGRFSDNRRRMILFATALAIEIFSWGFYAALFNNNVPNAAGIAGSLTVSINLTFFAAPLKQLVRVAAFNRGCTRLLPMTLSQLRCSALRLWVRTSLSCVDRMHVCVYVLYTSTT